MEKLVFAQLSGCVTFEMLEDRNLTIVQNNGVYIITTEENSKRYSEEFHSLNRTDGDPYFQSGVNVAKNLSGVLSSPKINLDGNRS